MTRLTSIIDFFKQKFQSDTHIHVIDEIESAVLSDYG